MSVLMAGCESHTVSSQSCSYTLNPHTLLFLIRSSQNTCSTGSPKSFPMLNSYCPPFTVA